MTDTLVEEKESGRLKRAVVRVAVPATTLALVVAGSGAAFADTTPSAAPDPSTAVATAASGISNGIVNGITTNIVYVVPVLVMFTLIAAVKRHTGAKRG